MRTRREENTIENIIIPAGSSSNLGFEISVHQSNVTSRRVLLSSSLFIHYRTPRRVIFYECV